MFWIKPAGTLIVKPAHGIPTEQTPVSTGDEPELVRSSGRSVTGRHGTKPFRTSDVSFRMTTEFTIHASQSGVHTSL
jgi:hypothetical protein